MVFLAMRIIFLPFTSERRVYEARDSATALYAPVSLIVLPVVWLILVLIGYMGIYFAAGVASVRAAFLISGSSLLTLGFAAVGDGVGLNVLAFSEAAMGLILVALLIAYLPTMYAAFSRRETAVTLLAVRAGTPPSAVEMILRFHRLGRLDNLTDLWATWEVWFAELEETHTSLAALAFFRSPQPHHSWVTAAGAILDGAALSISTLDTAARSAGEPLPPRRFPCPQSHRGLLRHSAQCRARARRPDQRHAGGIRRGGGAIGGGWCAAQDRPRAGMARFRRVARQLRCRAHPARRPDQSAARTLVLGPRDAPAHPVDTRLAMSARTPVPLGDSLCLGGFLPFVKEDEDGDTHIRESVAADGAGPAAGGD